MVLSPCKILIIAGITDSRLDGRKLQTHQNNTKHGRRPARLDPQSRSTSLVRCPRLAIRAEPGREVWPVAAPGRSVPTAIVHIQPSGKDSQHGGLDRVIAEDDGPKARLPGGFDVISAVPGDKNNTFGMRDWQGQPTEVFRVEHEDVLRGWVGIPHAFHRARLAILEKTAERSAILSVVDSDLNHGSLCPPRAR